MNLVARARISCAMFGLAVVLLLIVSPVFAGQNEVRRINRQGNRLYTDTQWADALAAYTSAGEIDPENPVLHYNLGNALYRLNDLDKAETHFRIAAAGEDLDLARQARFNLGNTDFRRAETMEGAGDWQGRNEAFIKAIENWQSVLETDPQNRDAKLNLELARKKLLEEPPENEQQQQQQDQQEEEQNEDQEEQQDQQQQQEQEQQEQPQDQQEQEDKGEEQESRSGEDQQEEQGEAQPQEGEDQEQAGEEQMEEMRISPEEAERILDALRDEELEEQRRQMAERKGRGGSAERDW